MKLFEIAEKIGCKATAARDVDIFRVAGIAEAGPEDLTFVSNRKYLSHLKTTKAGAVILGHDMPEVSIATLRTDEPYLAFAKAIELFYTPPAPEPGVDPSAAIAADARIGPDASIGPQVVIGRGCVIGARVVLHAHVVIYPYVVLGDGVILHSHVVVREHCRLGNRVIAQNGVVIGSDGFGF